MAIPWVEVVFSKFLAKICREFAILPRRKFFAFTPFKVTDVNLKHNDQILHKYVFLNKSTFLYLSYIQCYLVSSSVQLKKCFLIQ